MEHPLNPEYPYRDFFVSHIDFNNPGSFVRKMRIAFNILYSLEAKRKIERLLQIEKPDIVHLNNFAHQISPSILHIFKKHNIPVVMTMHDYLIPRKIPLFECFYSSHKISVTLEMLDLESTTSPVSSMRASSLSRVESPLAYISAVSRSRQSVLPRKNSLTFDR